MGNVYPPYLSHTNASISLSSIVLTLLLLLCTRTIATDSGLPNAEHSHSLTRTQYISLSFALPACFLLYKGYLYTRFKKETIAAKSTRAHQSQHRHPTSDLSPQSDDLDDSVIMLCEKSDQHKYSEFFTHSLHASLLPFRHLYLKTPIQSDEHHSPYETWLGSLYSQESHCYYDVVVKRLRESDTSYKLVNQLRCRPLNGRKRNEIIPNQLACFKQALFRHARVQHPYIATLYGFSWSRRLSLLTVIEFVSGGNLQEYIHRAKQYSPTGWSKEKLQLIHDVATAIAFLHSLDPPIVHGNCNARNVLLTNQFRAKLSDCGNVYEIGKTARKSACYAAPESLRGERDVTEALDVYCIGILMSELDAAERFGGNLADKERCHIIAMESYRLPVSDRCSTELSELIYCCVKDQPTERIRSEEIVDTISELLKRMSVTEETL